MKPKVGQKLTYVDECSKEFTAIIKEVFDHYMNEKFTLNIEYKRDDRSIGKVHGVPFIDGSNSLKSKAKVMCFSQRTPKKDKKASTKSIPNTSEIPPDTTETEPETSSGTIPDDTKAVTG